MSSSTIYASEEGSTNNGPATDPQGDVFDVQLISYTFDGDDANYGVVTDVPTDDLLPSGYEPSPYLIANYDQGNPYAPLSATGGLASDGAGNLFFWASGGSAGLGQIYELPKLGNVGIDYSNTPTVLSSFSGSISGIEGGMVVDAAGNLFGTAQFGGVNYEDGVVFELAKDDASATGYASSPIVIGSGGDDNTSWPNNLATDSAGDLFYTALGGPDAGGAVFEVARDDHSATGYDASPTLLGTFSGFFWSLTYPRALIVDAKGDLFIDAPADKYGEGVFEIAKDDASATGYSALTEILDQGVSSMMVDASGNLFATSQSEVIELTKDDATATGYAAAPTVLFQPGADFVAPADDLTFVDAGDEQLVVYGLANIISITSDTTPCYCRGALILTDLGEVAVEALEVGDRVVTRSGEAKAIRWIGRRAYAGWLAAGNPAVLPVGFKPGALADHIPRRDLWVSPEHAMFVDGALVPAGLLVNGGSIVKASAVEQVEYFHIELDTHEIIFAEGAAAETFVDDKSRGLFHNAPEYYAAHPGSLRPGPALYCAPRLEPGPELDALRERLAARAVRLTGQGIAPPTEIVGSLDRADREIVAGWAADRRAPGRRLGVVVLCNGATLARVVAEAYRHDLATAGVGDGRHAFEVKLDGMLAADRRHAIELRAADDWALLGEAAIDAGSAPSSHVLGPLRGQIDGATPTRVAGWAASEGGPAALVVSVNGRDVGRVVASRFRDDLQSAGVGDGRHGFEFVFPERLEQRQSQEIRVRREADGAELGATFLPAASAADALPTALAGLGDADEERALALLTDATEALLARRAERIGDAAAREAHHLFRRRWGRAPEAGPQRATPRALVIDERAPCGDRDAGSVAILSHMQALRALGFDVAFAAFDGEACEGVSALGRPYYSGVEDVLARHAGGFDLVYLHRLASAERYLKLARAWQPAARIVYSVADLHHLRLSRQARIERRSELLALARAVERSEMHFSAEADLVLTHSPYEARLLSRHVGAKARVVPFAVGERAPSAPFAQRHGVAFLGGFGHAPNADAAFWLTREILPRVWRRAPHITCQIAGHGWRADALGELDPRVEIVGPVENLDALFARVRLTVAPLRFGAGIKGKVLESFAAGLPCVMTDIAAEGLTLPASLSDLVASDADAYAAAIVRLHDDAGLCQRIGAQARVAAAAFSQSCVTQSLGEALGLRHASAALQRV